MRITDHIFSNNPKANGKVPWAVCWWNEGNVDFWVGLRKYIILAALYKHYATYAVDWVYNPFNKWSEKWQERRSDNPDRHSMFAGASGSELVKTLSRFFNFYPWSLQCHELSSGMSSFSNTHRNMMFICYENNPRKLFSLPLRQALRAVLSCW